MSPHSLSLHYKTTFGPFLKRNQGVAWAHIGISAQKQLGGRMGASSSPPHTSENSPSNIRELSDPLFENSLTLCLRTLTPISSAASSWASGPTQ